MSGTTPVEIDSLKTLVKIGESSYAAIFIILSISTDTLLLSRPKKILST
jgi:hypothetical protein